jgi:hypothetical protein
MAATLFALAAFRNTAPGTPPIGGVPDWFACLWAETVIALCLITVVTTGVRSTLRAALRTEDTPVTWGPSITDLRGTCEETWSSTREDGEETR